MKNILLIEDEENLNRGISLKLKKEGYAVFSAACVSEGLKLFQDNTIDLVICDIGLPDGSGLDLFDSEVMCYFCFSRLLIQKSM